MSVPVPNSGPPAGATMLRGAVVSDLHMFSSRSTVGKRMDEIHQAAEKSAVFVFNGDTFDFRWSRLGEASATSSAAIEWIANLAARHPHCQFHFVLGNHDANYKFQRALARLCNLGRNLDWSAYYLRLGDKIFLHGDVTLRDMDVRGLAEMRRAWQNHSGLPKALAHGYGAINRLGIDKAVCSFHPRRRMARRILYYLRHVEPFDAVNHVYFGHTHTRFEDYFHEGIQFHNSGAYLRGFRSRPLKFAVEKMEA